MSDFPKSKAPSSEQEEQLRRRIAQLEAANAELQAVGARLHESEDKFRKLLDNLSEAVVEYDATGRIVFASPQIFALVGMRPEEVVGRSGFEFVHRDDLAEMQSALKEALTHGRVYVSQYRIRHRDGRYVYVGGAGTVLREGDRLRIIGTIQDISDRRRVEEALRQGHAELAERVRQRTAELEEANAALRGKIAESDRAQASLAESEAKLSRLLENLPDFVIVVDRAARLLYANRPSPGPAVDELVGSIGFTHISEEDVPKCRDAMESVFRSGRVEMLEVRSAYGEHLECRLVPIEQSGEVAAAMIICTDISQRKLAAERAAREHHLLKSLFELNERERKLLSHEIHDGFVQDVVGAKMLVEAAAAHPQPQGDSTAGELEQVRSLLEKSIGEARRFVRELRPMVVDEGGVVEAIGHLLGEEGAESGLSIDFHHHVRVDYRNPILEGTVFRIVQEALNNVKRHSNSPTMQIRLAQGDHSLRLEISDQGVGFDPHSVPPERFGLRGIRERARLFGGWATIESSPGQGTRVTVELPLIPVSETSQRGSD